MSTQTRAADIAAAASGIGWLTTWATNALPIIQVVGGLIGILAGLFAIAVHYQRLKR